MIRKNELMEAARITGMKPHQQEKHYILTLVLRSLYSRCDMAFKGGTALMFADGLNRFSEDLDFTATAGVEENISDIVARDLALMGVKSVKKDMEGVAESMSFRIGAEGPLFTKEIERCYVRVDVSLRERVVVPPRRLYLSPQYPDTLPFQVSVMTIDEIAAEKIRAILTRNKARDVFDLAFLYRKGAQPTRALVDEKLKYYDMEFDLGEFEKRVEAKKGTWVSELKPVIFGQLPDFSTVRDGLAKSIENVDGFKD